MISVLAVFETAFCYGWRGSTARLLDFAHAVTARGGNFELLAGRWRETWSCSEQEEAFQGQIIRTPFEFPYPRAVRGRVSQRLYRDWLLFSGRAEQYRDPECGWASRAASWYKDEVARKPDLVMGLTTGQVGNLVAARRLSEHYDVPLVLEFQDPCPSIGLKKVYSEELAALERAMVSADAVITTTRGLANDLRAKYSLSRARFETVYMAFDKLRKPSEGDRTSGILTILHAGSLVGGAGRNVRIVVEAMALAVSRRPESLKEIRLVLLGPGAGGDEALGLARSLGIGSMVVVHPEVPMQEALEMMSQADILLVVKYSDARYSMQIPGKLFQYLGYGKPILGIMAPESEAAQILISSGLGEVIGNEDLQGVADFIKRACSSPGYLKDCFIPEHDFISQFSRDSMGARLVEVLASVVE